MITKDDIILVTGGTGFTGVNLVKKLCATGAQIRVIARPSSNRAQLDELPIDWFEGDVFDEQVVEEAVKGVSYIFHVAAAYREAKISDEVYWNVHVKSTQVLAKHALKQPGFKRFLHTSTIGVHGHIDKPPADENYRFAPGDQYQATKIEGEQWIEQFGKENQFPVTIVRPAGIYGPGDRRLLKLFKLAKLPITPILGIGCKNLYHLIHVDDLTDFMMVAATSDNTVGQTYICGNSRSVSLQQMVKVIADYLGISARFLRLPVTPFFIAGDLCEAICKPLGIEPPIYRRRVAFFTKDRSFNTEKMTRDTGFECAYSNEEGIIALTRWYQEQGWL